MLAALRGERRDFRRVMAQPGFKHCHCPELIRRKPTRSSLTGHEPADAIRAKGCQQATFVTFDELSSDLKEGRACPVGHREPESLFGKVDQMSREIAVSHLPQYLLAAAVLNQDGVGKPLGETS